jgi:hypothetical protein
MNRINQFMVVFDPDKAARLHAMASKLRQAAAETAQPHYRTRLLNVARDLETEAAKVGDSFPASSPADSSRNR